MAGDRDPIPVEITGPRTEVESVADNEIKAIVDMASARQGDRQLRVAEFQKPRRVQAVSLRSLRQFVEAEIQVKIEKRFPITVSFNDAPPSGRVFGRPRLNPSSAVVTGAREDVQRVKELAVYVETRGGAIRETSQIQALDAEKVTVDSVTVIPATTQIEIDLVPAPASRSLLVNVQLQGQPAPPYRVSEVSVSPSIVTVSGRPEQIAQLRNVTTGPVSLQALTADTTLEVPLAVPDGVSVRGSIATVRVTIRIRDTSAVP